MSLLCKLGLHELRWWGFSLILKSPRRRGFRENCGIEAHGLCIKCSAKKYKRTFFSHSKRNRYLRAGR